MLSVALAIALAGNVILALQVKSESDREDRLRAQAATLQDTIDTLRRQQDTRSIFERITSAVEQIRELRFLRTVSPRIITDEQLAAVVEQRFRAGNPRTQVEQDDAVLTAWGLLGPHDDLYDILLGVVREQVAGFYDVQSKRLVVGGNGANPSPLDQVLLAHEYVHAVTDQHFDLTRLEKLSAAHKDDEATAYLSLIEGDATVMMFRYAARYLTPSERTEVARDAAAAPSARIGSAPKAIRESLLFPYEAGRQFVQSLIDSGGISALNRAYQDPPTSTEQILHVSKYLSRPRDEPTPVQVPALAHTMGSGWSDIKGGGFGELDMRLLVDQFLPQGDADAAAAGWDGGRYAAAESAAGTVVATMTVWDSEGEARQAEETLARWLPARYGNTGNDVHLDGVAGRGWESPTGAGAVVRNGTRVLLVVAPDRASVDRARSAFPGF